ncbi:phosphodiester glycosidase family protein [Halobacillus andaensis]|uniref:phosphodiester glycosidase family protein n=1 Tax=Halobacillus andaensis TaxID=1176239 RepID=UPI00166BE0D7
MCEATLDFLFFHTVYPLSFPRSLVGIKENVIILLVTADDRNLEESLGLTFYDSALVLQSLGTVEGMNLDGRGWTTMVVEDQVVNLSSDPHFSSKVIKGK